MQGVHSHYKVDQRRENQGGVKVRNQKIMGGGEQEGQRETSNQNENPS